MIQSRQRLDEHVGAFVAELISAGNEEVQSLFEIEVEMTIEVTTNELVNLLFCHCVEILELMERREFLHIQSIGCDDVGLALQ